MRLNALQPGKFVQGPYLRAPIERASIVRLKEGILHLLQKTNISESEEYHKNLVRDFLRETFYPNHFINTKGTTDLVIHEGNEPESTVSVLIEVKSPRNKTEMVSERRFNVKAIHELALYFLRERIISQNLSITHLIVTNAFEWYIFDAVDFDRMFAQDRRLVASFRKFEQGRLSAKTTSVFYNEVIKPHISRLGPTEISCSHIDLNSYQESAKSQSGSLSERKLVPLYKVLSPPHLLKLPLANDNNTLDQSFYSELLHLMGLRERPETPKKIERLDPELRCPGSLLENTITQLQQRDSVDRLRVKTYGNTKMEREEAIALELVITWVNRIIFVKLLEAQQSRYKPQGQPVHFVDSDHITSFGDLDTLFFGVLNRTSENRSTAARAKFPDVPYLNSSLFELTDLERALFSIGNLDSSLRLSPLSSTVLRTPKGKRKITEQNALEYLLEFMGSYNFASEGDAPIEERPRTLINASVLGLIFEKINGYKDGSYFTPGNITMFLCRETLRATVVQKFKRLKKYRDVQTFPDLVDRIETDRKGRQQANDIIDTLRVADPSVGSGHFLVSALNEVLAIKSELGIMSLKSGARLKMYSIVNEHDELAVLDQESGEPFQYRLNKKGQPIPIIQELQESLFHEKRKIIENCLFGVDVNENSVKICRLRLWIELLKHSYYTKESEYHELETLPNLETNIKRGNSLVSEYGLHTDMAPNSGSDVSAYMKAVQQYRSAHGGAAKRRLSEKIEKIKDNARTTLGQQDPLVQKLRGRKGELSKLVDQSEMFTLGRKEQKDKQRKVASLKKEIKKLDAKVAAIHENRINRSGFEWRFEFPEVLDSDTGAFLGFDVIVANPPYLNAIQMSRSFEPALRDYLKGSYETHKGAIDIYVLFFELAVLLLKDGGHAAMITPNKYLSVSYAKQLREFMYAKVAIEKLVDYSSVRVFREASVYPVVTIFTKGKTQADAHVLSATSNDGSSPENYRRISAHLLKVLPGKVWGFLLNDKIDISRKIQERCVSLTEAGAINATSTAGEAARLHDDIVEGGRGFKLINTGTIDPWSTLWGIRQMRDKGELYLKPRLPTTSAHLTARRKELYCSPKIIFAKSALRVEAFWDSEGVYASINTNCIHSFSKEFQPKFVLGWIHSSLFHYIYTCFFDSVRMNGGYLPFNAPALRSMCIPALSPEGQNEISLLVDEVISKVKIEALENIDEYESMINRIFYQHFDLADSEVLKVEESWMALRS